MRAHARLTPADCPTILCLEAELPRLYLNSCLCSALSAWEAVAGLCRSYSFSIPAVQADVHSFLKLVKIQFVEIGQREFDIAVDAYARYGKGRHPAALNMGDCFAYACAKANRAKLLFKGDDFSKTDIEPAV